MYKKTLALLAVTLLSNYVSANEELTRLFDGWSGEEDLVVNGKPSLINEDGEEAVLHHNGEEGNDFPGNTPINIPIFSGEDLPINGGEEGNDFPGNLPVNIPVFGGEDLPINGGEEGTDFPGNIPINIPVVGGEDLPIVGGEHPVWGGESGHYVGETGEDEGVWPSAAGDDKSDEDSGDAVAGLDDNGSAIGSITDVLAATNSDDKACINDDTCLRNAQYCEDGCCHYKVCEGGKCGVSKIC